MPHAFPADRLDDAGLNRQAIFARAALPADLLAALAAITGPDDGWRQLILVGHGGRRLWDCVQAAKIDSPHPIDDYTIRTIEHCFAARLPEHRYRLIYPGEHHPVGLQQLGRLAGWHQPSPFMVGVDGRWGSWFAYRAVILADTDFAPTPPEISASPCATCAEQPCLAACPADALRDGSLRLAKCVAFRQQPDSPCAYTCLARLACPVGAEHRYDEAQLHHSYSRSLAMIRHYAAQS